MAPLFKGLSLIPSYMHCHSATLKLRAIQRKNKQNLTFSSRKKALIKASKILQMIKSQFKQDHNLVL